QAIENVTRDMGEHVIAGHNAVSVEKPRDLEVHVLMVGAKDAFCRDADNLWTVNADRHLWTDQAWRV
ncbi:MAG TPA: hypothetical protein VFR46_06565, partial [Actinomycetes bacterium]|nr:hypothetical protein [Actinomycetes bacterium]